MNIAAKESPVGSRSHRFFSSVLLPTLLIFLSALSWFHHDASDVGGSLVALNAYVDNDGRRTPIGTKAVISDELIVHVVRIRNSFLKASRMHGFVDLVTLVFICFYLAFGANTNKTRLIVSTVALTPLLAPIFLGPIH